MPVYAAQGYDVASLISEGIKSAIEGGAEDAETIARESRSTSMVCRTPRSRVSPRATRSIRRRTSLRLRTSPSCSSSTR